MTVIQQARYIEISQEEFTRDSCRWAEHALAGEPVLVLCNGRLLKLAEADPLENIPPPPPLAYTVEEGVRRGLEDVARGNMISVEELEMELDRDFPHTRNAEV